MAHILDGLNPDAYDRTYTDRQLIRRIIPMFTARGRLVAAVTAAAVVTALAGTAFPVLLARAVGAVTGTSTGMSRLELLMLGIVVAGVVAWLASFTQQTLSARLAADIVLALRTRTMASVLRQDMAFFDTNPTGQVASRIVSDTQSFATVVTLSLDLLSQVLLIAVMASVLLTVNVTLAVVTIVLGAVIILVTLGFRRIARSASQKQQRSLARINAYIHETLAGIAVARNFRQEAATERGLDAVNQQWFRASVRMNRLFSGVFPFLLTLTGLGTVLVVYFGGYRVADGSMSVGDWFLFLEALMLFWFPLTSLASFWSQFQQGLAAGERVFALADATPTVHQLASEPVGHLAGRVELRDVVFGYRNASPVLHGLNLTIEPGETVALVGHTGAGKSSIVRLITRSYEFQSGEILIDGRDIRRLELAEFRARLGIVPQRPFLFTGTVLDNIRYGRPDATEAEVEAAAAAVAGGDWIAALPQGLRTTVGEAGRNLSTGQRQLVGLARVILQDPSIFILDEATSSVDPVTDAQAQEGLEAASAGRTAIIIAHRLPTVRRADRIVVVGDGRILEAGTHDALMAAEGAYAGLYAQYFHHQVQGVGNVRW